MPYRGANECLWFEVQMEDIYGRRVRQVFAQQKTSKSKALTFRFYHDKNNYHFSTEKPEYDIVFHKLDACSCHLMKRIEVKIYCLVMQRFRLVFHGISTSHLYFLGIYKSL